jgi:hypothetical protein
MMGNPEILEAQEGTSVESSRRQCFHGYHPKVEGPCAHQNHDNLLRLGHWSHHKEQDVACPPPQTFQEGQSRR